MRSNRTRNLEAVVAAVLIGAAGLLGARAQGPMPEVVQAGAMLNAVIFFVVFLLIGGGLVWAYHNLVSPDGQAPPPAPDDRPPPESSPYEQILAELQGIKLTFESGSVKGNFPKLSRLVRVFLMRLGLSGAREMPRDRLMEAISHSTLSQKQTAMLISIIERCERGEQLDPLQLDFDPVGIVKDFRYLIYNIEGRPQD